MLQETTRYDSTQYEKKIRQRLLRGVYTQPNYEPTPQQIGREVVQNLGENADPEEIVKKYLDTSELPTLPKRKARLMKESFDEEQDGGYDADISLSPYAPPRQQTIPATPNTLQQEIQKSGINEKETRLKGTWQPQKKQTPTPSNTMTPTPRNTSTKESRDMHILS